MSIKNKILFSLLTGIAVSFFFTGTAFAACPSTPSASLGIHSGSSSALAGLIVHTRVNGTDTNMPVTISDEVAGENMIEHVNSSYQIIDADDVSSKTWNTGDPYYISSQSTKCSDTGYLWLGYGSSTAYGNTWALDCKTASSTDATFQISVNPPGVNAGGWFSYSISGAQSAYNTDTKNLAEGVGSVTIQVRNGYTAWVYFNWHPNTKPVATRMGPSQGDSYPIASGQTTTTVDLKAKATDVNGDKVAIQIAYRKQNTDSSWGNWKTFGSIADTHGPGDIPTTALYTSATKPAAYSNYGWKPTDSSGGLTYATQTSTSPFNATFTATLDAGTYAYRARAWDEHALDSGWSTSDITFTVTTATTKPACACIIDPPSGPATLSVQATVTINGIINNVKYDYDMMAPLDSSGVPIWDGVQANQGYTSRGSSVWWNYESPGTYHAVVRAFDSTDPTNTNKQATCACQSNAGSTDIKVSGSTGGSGTEVVPGTP